MDFDKKTFFQDTPVSDLTDVLMILGRVQEGVERLRQDFGEEKAQASQSRKLLYERQDEMRGDLSNLKQDIDMTALVTAQKLGDLTKELTDHKLAVQPSIDEWKRIRTLGIGITGVLAIGGLSVGAMLSMGLDAFRTALRSWLGG
jgi:hypothetical protein